MSALILGDIGVSLYAALSANSAFMTAIGNRLYENVPQNISYPLARLDLASNDNSLKTQDGEQIDINIHVWSTYRGSKTVVSIVNLAKQVLHKNPSVLTSATVKCTHLMYKNCPVIVDADNLARHAIARFTAFAQPLT